MKLEILIQLVGLLPRDPALAVHVRDLRARFYPGGRSGSDIQEKSELTNLRRYLAEMLKLGLVAELPPLPGVERLPRYHLVEHRLYAYFMHGKLALGMHWMRPQLLPLEPALGEGGLDGLARMARLTARERIVRDRVRIVPDGIGRAFADIPPAFVRTALDALESGCMLRVTYVRADGREQLRELSVLGLAQKDGTIYLIGSSAMNRPPAHYAMHRLRAAELLHRLRADARPDFDIDAYIEAQHQLAHVRGDRPSPVQLELLVHDCALFHFRERPLPGQRPIQASDRPGWNHVTATVPHTVMLVPFLWSHAPFVQVVGPDSVRDDVVQGLRAALALYEPNAEVAPSATG